NAEALKKASEANPHVLTPLHGFGASDSGVWCATEYYPRKSLREFIALQGVIDATALQHVVSMVVTGCLALKQSTGRSHGNLKVSNILVAGEPRPLAKSPVHLADPCLTSVLDLSEAGDRAAKPADDPSVRQRLEASDLRAIGELILQLTE